MIQATISLYEFAELSELAKQRAIDEHKDFLDSDPVDFEDENGEMLSEYLDHSEDEVIDSIEANEYLFFVDGSFARVVEYTAGPKEGTREFQFKGEIINI